VTQLVLPLHEVAADPAVADSTTIPAITEFVVEPLHAVVDPTTASATSTETSCLCV
jgi:hypothetical protein